MLAEANYLWQVTRAKTLEDCLEDPTLRKGLERSLEIPGEAAKATPREVRERWPTLPWSDMARMRDFLIHAYHRAEPAVVWKTATDDAAPLADVLARVVDAERRRG